MKTKNIYIILIIVILGASCKKSFLDVPTKSTLTLQEYVKDLNTLSDYMNGIYLTLSMDFYSGSNQIYPEIISDNIKPVSATSSFMSAQYSWSQQADQVSGSTANWNPYWRSGYQIIRSCSFVISKVEEYRNQNTLKADHLKGQAYAIRALTHFVLVNLFAQPYIYTSNASHPGIPYITVYDWNQPVSGRQTVSEVYTNLVADLNNAITLLPADSTNTTYLNHNAAKALLARIYLFKEDFTNSKNIAREVGLAKPIMTGAAYPSKLFTQQETEALFQLIPSSKTVNSGTYNTSFQARYFNAGSSTQCIATAGIATVIRQNASDLRKSWIKSGGKDTITKYPINPGSAFNPKAGDYYQTILRSSEMYLTAAEAYARLNNEDSARIYLNAIRTRANIPSLTSTVTGPGLLDSIYVERRRELAFEGLRMFDLLRWKKGVNRIDAWSVAAQNLPYPSNKAIAPIPLLDVTVTGLDQNPDY